MTISTAATPLRFNGDGATVDFAISWKYFAKTDVVVTHRSSAGIETVWVLNTDYALTDAGVDAGGTCTATTAPATGEKLVITLEPPNTQLKSIPRGGLFPSSNVEDALDLASQRDAKIESLVDRMLRVPITDSLSGSQLEIPNETDRASKFLAFDTSGTAIAASGTTGSGNPATAFTDTLLDDPDADTFWATLMATLTKATARSTFDVPSREDIYNQTYVAYADTGAVNAYVITPSPAVSALATYQKFSVLITLANTSATCTLTVGTAPAATIKLVDGSAPLIGMLKAGAIHEFVYDGTNMILLNPYGFRIDVLTAETAPIRGTDTLLMYDASGGILKKVTPQYASGIQRAEVTDTSDRAITGATDTDLFSLGTFTLPAAGVIRLRLQQVRWLDTSAAANRLGIGVKVNGVYYYTTGDDNGAGGVRGSAVNTDASQYVETKGLCPNIGAGGAKSPAGMIEIDIAASGMATGSQAITLAGYSTGAGTVKGATTSTICGIEVVDYSS